MNASNIAHKVWDEVVTKPQDLVEALKPLKLDIAYPGFRRNFLEVEAKRQRGDSDCLPVPGVSAYSAERQKVIFANYWSRLHRDNAIEQALQLMTGDDANTGRILETVLQINSSFHRMLVSRSFGLLFSPQYPRHGAALHVFVGGGAVKVVRACAGKGYELPSGHYYLSGLA